MTAPITRTHRLAVARAWFGADELTEFLQCYVDGDKGPYLGAPSVVAQLERLAQLVADAEGAWIPCMNDTWPTVGDRVLCMSSCNDHLILDYEGAGDFTDPEDDQVTIAVTHWRPMPKPPEQP